MRKIFLLSAVFVLFAIPALAQESIEKMYSECGSGSMIRKYGVKNWLIYSNPEFCDFSLVQDGNNSVNILRLPEDFISVSDFEIDIDIVYFCGMLSGNIPCMGYFKMSTFPNSTIYYIRLSNLQKLNKLEVMSDYTGTQVIMTGFTGQSYVIVDARQNATGWDVYNIVPYFPNITGHYTLDDVAIIDNHVVFTSRHYDFISNSDAPTPLLPFSLLWYFSKPTTAIVPLTMSTVKYLDVSCIFSSEIGIKKCENDAFVIAGTISFGYPFIGGYNGFTNIGSVTLDKSYTTIKDFSYNPDSRTTEIIIDPADVATNGSEIYTLLPGMATDPGISYGHKFQGHILKSICYQSNNPNHHICIGDNIGNPNDLFIYRYFCFYPLECSIQVSVETSNTKHNNEPQSAEISSTSNYHVVQTKQPIVKGTGTAPICESFLNLD